MMTEIKYIQCQSNLLQIFSSRNYTLLAQRRVVFTLSKVHKKKIWIREYHHNFSGDLRVHDIFCSLLRNFRGVRGQAPRERFWNIRSVNCWKCIKIVNHIIKTLFCIISNLLRSHQADLFGT